MPAKLKDPSVRARRNKTSTRATLQAAPDVEAPELPPLLVEAKTNDPDEAPMGDLVEVAYHPMALDFWDEVWSSPMAGEYLDADVPGLILLATLVHSYWTGLARGRASKDLAAEIRQQRQEYGLTPIARRRLEWELERAEDAKDRGARRRRRVESETPAPEGESNGDPRLMLVQ